MRFEDELRAKIQKLNSEAFSLAVSIGRHQAIEEAAKVAEDASLTCYCETTSDVREDLAEQIRSLKEE